MLRTAARKRRDRTRKREQVEGVESGIDGKENGETDRLASQFKRMKFTRVPGELRLMTDIAEVSRCFGENHVVLTTNLDNRLRFAMRLRRHFAKDDFQDLVFSCSVTKRYPHAPPTFTLMTNPSFPVSSKLRCDSIPGVLLFDMLQPHIWLPTYSLRDCIVQLLRLFYESTDEMDVQDEQVAFFADSSPALQLPNF